MKLMDRHEDKEGKQRHPRPLGGPLHYKAADHRNMLEVGVGRIHDSRGKANVPSCNTRIPAPLSSIAYRKVQRNLRRSANTDPARIMRSRKEWWRLSQTNRIAARSAAIYRCIFRVIVLLPVGQVLFKRVSS